MEHGGDRHRRQPAARVMGQSPVSYGGWLAELAGYGRAEVRDYASLKEAPVGQTIAFRGLLGWAFRPRNFMKNPVGSGDFLMCGVVLRPCHAWLNRGWLTDDTRRSSVPPHVLWKDPTFRNSCLLYT